MLEHGGRLDAAIDLYGGERADWLDLSTGINQQSWPLPDLEASVWQRLPDAQLELSATSAARQYYEVGDAAHVACGAGSQALIQLLPFCYAPQNVAIVGFTYGEHAPAWRRAGHEVFVADGLESAEATARIVVVVHPNNPDGHCYDRDALLALARRLGQKGGVLVCDEAFCDTVPDVSLGGETGSDGLVVLKSFGKFFGLAGVRLGFAFGPELLIERLKETLGPWPVSGPALAIGADAFQDAKWIKATRKKLAKWRSELEVVLLLNRFELLGGTDLFVLVQHFKSAEVADHLAKVHILVRQFSGQPGWLRFGVPIKKRDLARLSDALSSFRT
ncbi:MAG: threonine-phosphate decarboxylase CobD [Pseudomonadota bacterium]